MILESTIHPIPHFFKTLKLESGNDTGKHYTSYPTLFQDSETGKWTDFNDKQVRSNLGHPGNFARKRNEEYEFPTEAMSKEFGEGAWKNYAPGFRRGGILMYQNGGNFVDDLFTVVEEGWGNELGTLNRPKEDFGKWKWPAAVAGHTANLGGRVLASLPKLAYYGIEDPDAKEAGIEAGELGATGGLGALKYKSTPKFKSNIVKGIELGKRAKPILKKLPYIGAAVEEASNQAELASMTDAERDAHYKEIDNSMNRFSENYIDPWAHEVGKMIHNTFFASEHNKYR